MDGIEAWNAMKEGKIVENMYRVMFRMKNDIVQCFGEGGWKPHVVGLNVWMSYNYELLSGPPYNLTFFEAMCEAAHGRIVNNMEYPDYNYCMKDGVLRGTNGLFSVLELEEINTKWRVVEEEGWTE